MPVSKRKIKPTAKTVSNPSTTKRAKSTTARSKARAASLIAVDQPILRTLIPLSRPPPILYIAAWTIQFEHEILEKSSEIGKIDNIVSGFKAAHYLKRVKELVNKKAKREGIRAYLFKNEIIIHHIDRKAKPSISINWREFDSYTFETKAQPVIKLLAAETKKGQSATISVDIQTTYSRYQDHLPDPLPPNPPPATSTQQPAASQTTTKKKESTTTKMLTESRERDELTTRDTVNLVPLINRWHCKYSMCPNYPKHGQYYVEDRQYYRIQYWMFGEWQAQINTGNADIDHMPPDIRSKCALAAKPRPTKTAATPAPASTPQPIAQPPQPWGFPYMMPPTAPYMPPFGYFPPQQTAPQPTNPLFHPRLVEQPPTSNPPDQPDSDPDELIKAFFNRLIRKYPSQATALTQAHKLLYKEAIDVDDLWKWLFHLIEYPSLASINQGIRKRIKLHLKHFLRSPDSLLDPSQTLPQPPSRPVHVAIRHILSPEEIDLTQDPPSAQVARAETDIDSDGDSDGDSENLNPIESGDEL